jgi:putative transposase
VRFIDAHKGRFGVAPICRVLSEHGITIAPSSYYDAKNRPPSKRSLRDDELKVEIARVHGENYGVYGPARCGCSSAVKASGWPAARWND